jgi:hypothetical protein
MPKKTKAPWEEKLLRMDESPFMKIGFSSVTLIADGYKVSFSNFPHQRSILIQWFIDGVWKGEFSKVESEVGQKFGRPIYMKIDKRLRDLEWLLNKNRLPKQKLIGYGGDWPNAKAAIKHLKQTCKKIELNNE